MYAIIFFFHSLRCISSLVVYNIVSHYSCVQTSAFSLIHYIAYVLLQFILLQCHCSFLVHCLLQVFVLGDLHFNHHHLAAVVSRGWAKASACHLQVSLSCTDCPLPDRVLPVCVQVVSPSLGLYPLLSFLVVWYPCGGKRGPSVVFEAVDVPCP